MILLEPDSARHDKRSKASLTVRTHTLTLTTPALHSAGSTCMAMDATSKTAYTLAIVMQVIYTGLSVLSKAALDDGMSIFVFNFYRQATGSLLLFPLALLFQRSQV